MKTIFPIWLICLLAIPRVCAAENPDWTFTLTEAEWSSDDIIRVPFTLTGTLITVRALVVARWTGDLDVATMRERLHAGHVRESSVR